MASQQHDAGFGRTTRAGFLGAAAGVAGGALAGRASSAGDRHTDKRRPDSIPFTGRHQAGITTPVQSHALFVGFTLTKEAGVGELRTLLRDWTAVARRLTRNATAPARARLPQGAPRDSGEATDLGPARLTVTIGLGPGLFGKLPRLAGRRPPALKQMPQIEGEKLNPSWSGGDLLLQICADDAQVVSHAFRQLRPRVIGAAQLAWTQQGFVSRPDGKVPRNLFGQHDGTANPRPGSPDLDRSVWVQSGDGPDWTVAGTYLVFRKIRMDFPTWDQAKLADQEGVLGRRRRDGAPLSGGGARAELDLDARGGDRKPQIRDDAHVRLAHRFDMFRRSYNYDYGTLTASAAQDRSHAAAEAGPHHHDIFDAGSLFSAFARDPERQVAPALELLAKSDAMHRFLEHTAGAVFFMPPGVGRDGYVGEGLLSGVD